MHQPHRSTRTEPEMEEELGPDCIDVSLAALAKICREDVLFVVCEQNIILSVLLRYKADQTIQASDIMTADTLSLIHI